MKSKGKIFFSNVIPALIAFVFIGLYTIVDGYFVGNSVGDDGLTAIGLVYPIVAILAALGTGIGMGGAVLQTISSASGDEGQALKYRRCTITLLIISSVICTAVFTLLAGPILRIIGAQGRVFDFGKIYLRIIFAGSIVQVMGAGLPPLIRNHDGARWAMIIMTGGCACNILLDYLFVMRFGLGVAGAAAATVTGQVLPFAGGIAFFLRRRIPAFGPLIDPGKCLNILKTGAATFGITICPSIVLLLMNLFAVRYGGLPAVTCYTIVSYVTWIIYLVLQGTGDGCQPLISESFGRKDLPEMKAYLRIAYTFTLVMAMFCVAALFLARSDIGPVFGASEGVGRAVAETLPILLPGFIPLSYARIAVAKMYATADSDKAIILTFAEPALLFVLLLVLTPLGGLPMVWWSMTISQCLTAILAKTL